MKKRFWAILFSCFAFAFASFSACGQASENALESSASQAQSSLEVEEDEPNLVITEGLDYEKIEGKDEYRVIGVGSATETDIVIPSIYNDLPVTEIGDNAFDARKTAECMYLTSVVIPYGVISIGYAAFYGCESLTRLVIPNSVTTISNSAITYCFNLFNLVIPDSVTYIGEYAFYDSTCLTSVTLSKSITSINYYSFFGCSSLTAITIPRSVTSIEFYAFSGCSILATIRFDGTVNEWKQVSKKSYWNNGVPATEVICTDGTVAL